MAGYALRFAILAPLLFALVYVERLSPLYLVNLLQTELTQWSIRGGIALFGWPVGMHGYTLTFGHQLQLAIVQECNGMVPFLLFAAAVAAFPAGVRDKIRWLCIGYAAIMTLNLVRLLAIVYGVMLDPANFTWLHDTVGRLGMGLVTLLLFYRFMSVVEVMPSGTGMAQPRNKHQEEEDETDGKHCRLGIGASHERAGRLRRNRVGAGRGAAAAHAEPIAGGGETGAGAGRRGDRHLQGGALQGGS